MADAEDIVNELNGSDKKEKKSKLFEKLKADPWRISTLVFAVLAIVLFVFNFSGGITGNVISENQANEKIMYYLNDLTGGGVEFSSIEDLGNIYQVNVMYQGREIPTYMTKDGEYFVSSVSPLAGQVTQNQQSQQTEAPKSDKPVVELFVMTHCPYGTQAEKGFLPTIVALGDKIDASVKFVHYFLHAPEEDETPVQICIREEQGDKFNSYLKEFLVDGDTDASLIEAGIDKTELDDCIANRADSYYAEDSALSEGYGVRGSPTLVVNGQIVQSGRSAAAYLDTICSAFNDSPGGCEDLDLDAETPSSGFGYGTTSSVANAQC